MIPLIEDGPVAGEAGPEGVGADLQPLPVDLEKGDLLLGAWQLDRLDAERAPELIGDRIEIYLEIPCIPQVPEGFLHSLTHFHLIFLG